MIKKLLASITLTAVAAGLTLPACAEYPQRNIQAVVPWGAGGATDIVMRSLIPHVEKELGGKFIINNRTGGTGVIGSNYVLQQRPDGHTVLLAAENAQLYPLLGLADFDYGDFHTINLIGQNVAVIAVPADSPYNSMADLLAAAKAKPSTLRMGVTGAGGLPGSVHAMIEAVDDLKVREVTFAGDGPGITAMLGGHLDFMPLSLIAAKEMITSGKLKGLAVVSAEENAALPGVAPITDALPEMKKFLPWGPFWGVWVRQDIPDEAKQKLTEAFSKAVAKEEFQSFLTKMGALPLNLTGDEAKQYLDRWQSVTTWSLYEAGAAQTSPESLGIPKP
ncbi:MAG: tricarboxylate transport protein TctC [Pseudomonas sp.]|jgi:tripartite-type tricarboxylate transporter receptor subunit TctC|nr:tricarboxylate transport protein TctC [Pseudomonadales bacterium]MAK87989.1 tricarboxylate transport protein TctC [Pseudomonas sp.]|tara:strand:+ start:14780 stop:15781 length:1002 start_codon:yes stop_codon:yes gene_type:complete